MSLARLKPFYVSLGMRFNDHVDHDRNQIYDPDISPRTAKRATITEQYNHPIVEKASDYLIAIERLEISLNGIPFYDAAPHPQGSPPLSGHEVIYVRSRVANVAATSQTLTLNCYSLTHLLTYLNSLSFIDPNLGDAISLTFTVDKDGFIILRLLDRTFAFLYFEFPRRLNQILGISNDIQLPGNFQAISSYPRMDCGDDLDHLILVSNLPTVSDAIGNAKVHVLTDFAPPTAYSTSQQYNNDVALVESGFTGNIRQKAIYYPNERRYLELIGDFPINNIDMQMLYRNTDNDLKEVVIPFGGCFEVKLGFFLKQ